MEHFDQSIELFIANAGWMAPAIFILLHLLRPFLLLPVIVVCIIGGLAFGFLEGALLSFVGLTLMSIVSYFLVNKFPRFRGKMSRLKQKIFTDRILSVSQVMILRIMPFVHFHLLSLYLMEMTRDFKEYMYYSSLGLIMPAVLYTAFGQAITALPWYLTFALFIILAIAFTSIDKFHKVRPSSQN